MSRSFIRFTLTVLAALILIAVTGFNGICMALERFHVPKAFSVQLMMLYRYIFVLTSEAVQDGQGQGITGCRRTGTRASGYTAPSSATSCCGPGTGRSASIWPCSPGGLPASSPCRRPLGIGPADIAFTVVWCLLFMGLRLVNLPQVMGKLIMGVIS